jgi:hypothetical protein
MAISVPQKLGFKGLRQGLSLDRLYCISDFEIAFEPINPLYIFYARWI